MDAEENQRQVFLRAHSPWKSQTTRFPHSHSRCSAWKSGKPKAGFPLSHLLSLLFNQIKKGNPAADRFAPASRLILQLENAHTASQRLALQGRITNPERTAHDLRRWRCIGGRRLQTRWG